MPQRCFSLVKTFCVIAGLTLVVATGGVFAQNIIGGAISGTITDSSGAVIPGATVTATNEATGVSTTATSGGNGFYSIEQMASGVYTVTVSKTGFEVDVTRGLQIDPGMRGSNNVVLRPGSTSTQVTVTASPVQVNTETGESGGTITAKQINNLLLNGRNFLSLASMVPGVININGGDAIGTGGINFVSTLIINGGSAEYQNYTIDGATVNDIGSLSALNVLPIVDGISEMRVLKDNYSAKYGLTGSGQIVIETQSGGSEFHGTAWEYLRNSAFDADNYFSNSKQALHQNIFGYTFGGPLTIPRVYNANRKKTFFFASNQWQLINESQVTRGAVFTQAMRQGNFSTSPTLSGNLTLDAHSASLLASTGRINCIAGPKTLNTSCFDPVAVALMNAYWPLPNNPAGGFQNYINQGPLTTTQTNYQYRIDHYVTPSNLLVGRVLYQEVSNGYPYQSNNNNPAPTQTQQNYTRGLNALGRLVTTFTPNLVNSLALAETYDKATLTSNAPMPAGITIQQANPGQDPLNRIPNISVSKGWAGMGVSQYPQIVSDGEGIASDDVSWVKRSHVLQVGALYMFAIKHQNGNGIPQGTFTFTGTHTGDPAADYLLGLNASYSQGATQRVGVVHFRQGEAYVQDDWKVNLRLTLNLGLRWVYFSNDTISGDQVTSFSPSLYNPNQAPVVNVNGSLQINSQNQPITSGGQPANLENGLVFAGQNGTPSGFYIPNKTNFGPRLGFAYDLTGDGKNALRGGFGIGFSRRPVQQIFNAWSTNPPYNPSANILNSLLSNATAGGTAKAPTTQTLQIGGTPNFVPGRVETYSLTLEHQVARGAVFQIAYVGSNGNHLESGIDENQPLSVNAPTGPNCLAPNQLPSSHYDFDPCVSTGTSSRDYTRPYQGYSTMTNHAYDDGTSNYNSLQSGFVYRVANSQLNVAYTWGKVLATCGEFDQNDQASFGCSAQNSLDRQAEYGSPDYDFRNNLTTSWVYSIPFFAHGERAKTLALGNWSFAGIALYQSGFAVTPTLNTSTTGLDRRPDQAFAPQHVGRLSEWFTTNSFVAPPFGFYGTASNGSIRGPGQTSVNVSVYKNFPVLERLNLQFRAEAFNVLNRPNYDEIDAGLGDGSYGQVLSAHDPRIMEFAAKLIF